MSKTFKGILSASIGFLIVCGLGFFCCLAGGVHWGTFDAGYAAIITFMMATTVFALISLSFIID